MRRRLAQGVRLVAIGMALPFVGICLAVFASAVTAQDKVAHPNVLLIIADDLGQGDLGCWGSDLIESPALDRLAAEGVMAENFYVNGPYCSPTRAAIMTGRYGARTGVEGVIRPGAPGLPLRERTLAQELQAAGYATALIGKWHLGNAEQERPTRRGFDEFFGILEGTHHYYDHTHHASYINTIGRDNESLPRRTVPRTAPSTRGPRSGRVTRQRAETPSGVDSPTPPSKPRQPAGARRSGTAGTGLSRQRPQLPSEPEEPQPDLWRGLEQVEVEGYTTDLLTGEALAYLDRRGKADKPFFLCLSYTAPHTPLIAPEKWIARYQDKTEDRVRRTYAAMVACMDDGIRRVLNRLDDLGMAENTLVFFLSDHGGTPRLGADNSIFRGQKGTLYEGGVRSALIARWPGRVSPGSKTNALGAGMDLFVTILKVAGANVPKDRVIDGRDFMLCLTSDAPSPHEFLVWRNKRSWACRQGQWKAVGIMPGRTELFNLDEDPSESVNIAADHAKLVAQLKERWGSIWGKFAPGPGPARLRRSVPPAASQPLDAERRSGGIPSR